MYSYYLNNSTYSIWIMLFIFGSLFANPIDYSLDQACTEKTLTQSFSALHEQELLKQKLRCELLQEIFSTYNVSFSYYDNPTLRENLSDLIAGYILKTKGNPQDCIEHIKKLYETDDFRSIALFLNSLYQNSSNLDEEKKTNTHTETFNITFTDSVDSIFSDSQDILVYTPNEIAKNTFLSFLNVTNGDLIGFIDNSLDLPGRYSLVRKGLVKGIPFHKGVVAKKNNPEKEGRFLTEQKNIEELKKILGLSDQYKTLLIKEERDDSIYLKLLSPFAVFSSGPSQKFYSLSFLQPGKTLEEVLISEKNLTVRKKYLDDIRLILNLLYTKGVIWGDMAPRNILVEHDTCGTIYTILDFEKTVIMDRPASQAEREEHARGPMCIEEFGAICSADELLETFAPYHDPAKWDLASKEIIPFKKPKREVTSILEARRIEPVTLGVYNSLEKEILQIRLPQQSCDNKIRYPLSISFKVDHYLGNTHDLKTTEVLIASKKHNLLFPVMDVLEKFLEILENRFILIDFENLILNKQSLQDQKKCFELDLVAEVIDSLYEVKDSALRIKEMLEKFNKVIQVYLTSKNPNGGKNGLQLSKSIYDIYSSEVLGRLKKLNLGIESTIFISGGFAKQEVVYGSDVDIGLFNFDPSVSSYITSSLKEIGLDSEFYSAEQFDHLEHHPDLFLDASHLLSLNDDGAFAHAIHQRLSELKKSSEYVQYVLQSYWGTLRESLKKNDFLKTIKDLNNLLEVLHYIHPLNKDLFLQCKSYLLFLKARLRVGDSFERIINQSLFDNIMAYTESVYKRQFLDAHKSLLNRITFEFDQIKTEYVINKMDPGQAQFIFPDDQKFLAPTLIPNSTTVLCGRGASLLTDRGLLIDLSSMTVNCILGQNDPWVIKHQVAYLLSGRPSFHSSRVGSSIYYEYPKRLHSLKIGGITNVLINHKQTNGSDIVDLSLKAASIHKRNRHKIFSFKGSYHGQNLAAYISSELQKNHQFLIPDTTTVVEFLDLPEERNNPLEDGPLTKSEQDIIKLIHQKSREFYAIILEPIQGNNGYYTFSKPFLSELRNLCSRYEICLIFDEVQTGFGYLGKLSAAEVYGVVPDILLFGKAVTGGNGPLAVMAFAEKFTIKNYGITEKTNGADLRALVAANAVLDRLIGIGDVSKYVDQPLAKELEQGLLKDFSSKEDLLMRHLQNLKKKYPGIIKAIKGLGFMRGLVLRSQIDNLSDEEFAEQISIQLLKKGVLVRRTKNTLIIKPPIVIKENELDLAFSIIDKTLLQFNSSIPISS